MERIALAREYRVAQWLRDAYLELTQKLPLDFEELQPAKPYSNGESSPLGRSWEATSRDWETLARIFYLQTKMATSIMSRHTNHQHCNQCGALFSDACACRCLRFEEDPLPRKLPVSYAMVDETFRGELESFSENPGHFEIPLPPALYETSGHVEIPLPRKLPISSYLCPLKTIFYSQQQRQRNTYYCYCIRELKEEEEGKEMLLLIEIVNFSFMHFIAQPVLASM